MIIQSAGMLSPDLSVTMSPGTTSSAGISCGLLSRNTVVFNCTISNNLATASVAPFSCQNPSSPLTITIEIMIIASSV
jgi:1-aminocyclopropane-1-carboxylate deaminase/D-cysteine desulfhydrase-like pyridoxal-dependent ACC family enzyme